MIKKRHSSLRRDDCEHFLYLIAFVCFAIPGYNWFATGHLSGTFSIIFGILMLYWAHRRKRNMPSRN